ncbi:MAG: mfd [Clostridia bacterium]|jgi:transcription-repair coupling factor (superfamily II helicase)|nr:mfd [Clostridia bacterium]
MSFKNILKPLENMQEYKLLMESIKGSNRNIEAYGISDTQKSLISAAVSENTHKSCLIITHNEIAARKIYEDIGFLNPSTGLLLSSGEIIFRKIDARSSEIKQQRLLAIKELLSGETKIVCASVEALLHKMVPASRYQEIKRRISLGDIIDIDELVILFYLAGYERVDMVEGKGQFSIRGGIIDFYPLTEENPIRIELFDDEVDSIRTFDAITQRSIEKIKSIEINAARELLLHNHELKSASQLLEHALGKRVKALNSAGKKKDAEKLSEIIKEDIDKLNQGVYFEGIERYLSFFKLEFSSILDYLKDFIIIIDEPNRVRQRYDNIELEFHEHFKQLLAANEVLPDQYGTFFTYDQLLMKFKNSKCISFNTLLKSSADFKPDAIISFVARSMHPFHGKLDLLMDELQLWKSKKYKVVILSGTEEKGRRLVQSLIDQKIEAIFKSSLDIELQDGHVVVIPGTLNSGFEFPSIRYAVISDREVFTAPKKEGPKKKGRLIKVFTDLKVGDFVVHENHGIGQYVGIEKLTVGGLTRDYLNIKYGGNDKLYIPTDQLDMIQKYIGGEDKLPKLNKLGSAEWTKTKSKAQKSIQALAIDLLKLYAERQQKIGFSFSADTRWQKEFEDMFPYEETEDQLRSIEEIKRDMEDDRAMDRLLCGDVGYGKTEVALRAAFKCVMDSKQAAILAPTTILAQQHYNTCIQRFGSFPIKIDVLSRFKSAADLKKAVQDVKNGTVDVIIGTHKLLQDSIKFKDLGLLIIDEEQKFGVAHKEKIKSLKTNVDVLTLSATPIPRTLHMSMIGIRDISVIEQPPEERYPVQTYVMEHNEDVIRDAIFKEIARGGQVYFLHNRVRSIAKTAAHIKELVPEARVAYAHGQMEEKVLEDTMLDFYNGESDVLVCTTIIEAGLDIPNVNTIIISDADKMGLSQLYQLRGRVGRSNRLAYAYFTYQKDKVLNEIAEKRLQAIKEFTEFGSGFKIAMRDLEIRGTGNVLGKEQHGHMEAIGYDLFIKLLEETLKELKGEAAVQQVETSIELQINAYIPETYISDENQKIEMYKKIASLNSQQDLFDIEEEIEDRFGDIPAVVRNLLSIAYVKQLAQKCGISNISQKNNNIAIKFKTDKFIKPQTAIQIAGDYKGRILFTASEQPYFTLKATDEKAEEILKEIREIIEKISSLHIAGNEI